MSSSRKSECKDIPPTPPLQPPSPPEKSQISPYASSSCESPTRPSKSNCPLSPVSPCTADSADTKPPECESHDRNDDDDTLSKNLNCGALGFNTKLRSVSSDSNYTASTWTMTAEEESASRDSPSPRIQDVSMSQQDTSAVDDERVEQQREQTLQNRALQTLLRDVSSTHCEEIHTCVSSSDDNDDFGLTNIPATVSSPGKKLRLRERMRRRLLKTSKKQPTMQPSSTYAWSNSAISSDGESLSSVRRRRRVFKKRTSSVNTDHKEEPNVPVKEQDLTDNDENNTSDILTGYTSLTDDYMIGGSDKDQNTIFSSNIEDDGDGGNSTDEEMQAEGKIHGRKTNIKHQHNHQCRQSRSKAGSDSDNGSLLDRDQTDGDDNNDKEPLSSSTMNEKNAEAKRHNGEQYRQKLPGSKLVGEKIHRKKAIGKENNKRGELPAQENRVNKVQMHVYDLIASETMLPLPWGCDFPIGKCFSAVNSTLHALGTGAYHVGVEVNGIEYAFGANSIEGRSGVFTSVPKKSLGYEYRTTIDFGDRRTIRKTWISVPKGQCTDLINSCNESSHLPSTQPKKATNYVKKRNIPNSDAENGIICEQPASNSMKKVASAVAMAPLQANVASAKSLSPQSQPSSSSEEKVLSVYREVETFMDGHSVMVALSQEYMGTDYDILRKNCCTFALEALIRLGVPKEEIPAWFYNITEAGAATDDTVKDVEENVFSPLRRMMSGSIVDDDDASVCEETIKDQEYGTEHYGFEVIAKSKRGSVQKTEMEIVKVVESIVGNGKGHCRKSPPSSKHISSREDSENGDNSIGIRHTLS